MAKTGGFSTMLDAATRRAFNFLRGEVDTLDERVTIIESGGGGDFPEAPLDGQQYGRQDAAWSVIELDDGEHVLTGDPENPPAELDAGQLLWDGVEGGGGSGGGGGPHDHAEYALVEHDHDEFTHDHDDYLPLSGGTVTGDLQVDGQIKTTSGGNKDAPVFQIGPDKALGMYGSINSQYIRFVADGEYRLQVGTKKTTVYQDLQVDGNSDLKINVPADFWSPISGTVFTTHGMCSGSQGSYATSMTANGYRNTSNKWTSMGVNGSTGAVQIDLAPTGNFHVRVASNHPTGSSSSPPIRFTVSEAGPTFRAQPSKTRSTDEVLERAETAEFPPEDDEGVATMDQHDEVPLFEVVTALLAKVKELSAEIEELRGA